MFLCWGSSSYFKMDIFMGVIKNAQWLSIGYFIYSSNKNYKKKRRILNKNLKIWWELQDIFRKRKEGGIEKRNIRLNKDISKKEKISIKKRKKNW